jgi:hypothetical protein
MTTMIYELYARSHQAGRAEFHAGLDRLARKAAETFREIARIQFKAPWKSGPQTRA